MAMARFSPKVRSPPHVSIGPLDESASAAVERGDGSHCFYRLDLRSLTATCGGAEGRASVDAEGHCSGEKEERKAVNALRIQMNLATVVARKAFQQLDKRACRADGQRKVRRRRSASQRILGLYVWEALRQRTGQKQICPRRNKPGRILIPKRRPRQRSRSFLCPRVTSAGKR